MFHLIAAVAPSERSLNRAALIRERKHMKHEVHQHFAGRFSHYIVRGAFNLE